MEKAVLSRALARLTFVVVAGGPRHRALQDLRKWKDNKDRYKAERYKAAHGFVLAKRVSTGALRPWNLGKAAACIIAQSGRRVAELMSWAVASEHTLKRRGVRATHAQWAVLLGCCPRTAGSTVRAAVESGYLERCPWFVPTRGELTKRGGGKKRDQRECCYQLSPAFKQLLKDVTKRGVARGLLAGKKCQPPEVQFHSETKKVSPSGMIDSTGAVKAVNNASVGGRAAPEQLRRAREHEARQYLTEQMAMPAHRVAEIDPDIAAWSAKAGASYARRCAVTAKQN